MPVAQCAHRFVGSANLRSACLLGRESRLVAALARGIPAGKTARHGVGKQQGGGKPCRIGRWW